MIFYKQSIGRLWKSLRKCGNSITMELIFQRKSSSQKHTKIKGIIQRYHKIWGTFGVFLLILALRKWNLRWIFSRWIFPFPRDSPLYQSTNKQEYSKTKNYFLQYHITNTYYFLFLPVLARIIESLGIHCIGLIECAFNQMSLFSKASNKCIKNIRWDTTLLACAVEI